MDWVDKPQNYKDLYGILQLLRGSHLNNCPLKTRKLGWVALHSVTFQFKCLDFQSDLYKKLVPVLSRFYNGLCPQILTVGRLAHKHQKRVGEFFFRNIFFIESNFCVNTP